MTFTATAAGVTPGCAAPEFKFFLQAPGGAGWTAQGGWGGNTWTWNTTGLKGGVYGVGVWARYAGSTAAYESYWLGTYTLSVTPCSAATITTSTASPKAAGTSIAFTAAATRCPGAQYRFWVQAPGGSFVMKRDYGAGSWTWDTTGLAAGTYLVGVWAQQPGSAAQYDTYAFTTFVLSSATSCNATTLTPSLSTPRAPGTAVNFTGSSNGCAGAQYQFWLLPPGGRWTVKQTYSSITTWSWETTGAALGTYQVGVWAKSGASSASYDAYFIGTYQLDLGPCTAATIAASPASPQAAATPVTFTATAEGCSAAQFEFWRAPGASNRWTAVQAWGTGNTWTWDTTSAGGPYRVGVWVRQNGSPASYDSYAIVTYWVTG